MRIVLIGAVEFSRHCLIEILKNGGNVCAVITLPQEEARRHSDYADLSDIAKRHGIPIYFIKNVNTQENLSLIKNLKPDVIFVFGWSQLVSKALIDIPPKGCIGSHPALLPRNRGRHPLIWTLVEGLKESGLTFFYIDEGADSGDILWQKPFTVTPEDDAATLYQKMTGLASQAIKEFLPALESGTAPRHPQDHTRATYWPKRTEKDGEIVWSTETRTTANLIRALTHPYVGAHTFLANNKMTIWRARVGEKPLKPEQTAAAPGTIIGCTNKECEVRTQDGYLVIFEYELTSPETLKIGAHLGGKAN